MFSPKWIIIATAAIVFTGCTQATPTTDTTPQVDTMPAEGEVVPETIVGQDEGMVFTPVSVSMVMDNFAYAPNSINVRPGDMVTVMLDNPDSMPHDFVIDELAVNSGIIEAGDSMELTFTIPPDTSGQTFAFYCSVGNHREQGMEGTILVE
jgi:plastocyanin